MWKIKRTIYYNSMGEIVTEEEFEKEKSEFQNYLEKEYNKKLNVIIDSIPKNISKEEQLKTAYLWLVNNVKFDSSHEYNSDGTASAVYYAVYNNWKISNGDKYAPLLVGKGICAGIAPVMNDICKKLNIEYQQLFGNTREIVDNDGNQIGACVAHTWNAVNLDGTYKHLDVVYGIYSKNEGKDPLKYFMIDDESFKKMAPHHNYDESIFSNKKSR